MCYELPNSKTPNMCYFDCIELPSTPSNPPQRARAGAGLPALLHPPRQRRALPLRKIMKIDYLHRKIMKTTRFSSKHHIKICSFSSKNHENSTTSSSLRFRPTHHRAHVPGPGCPLFSTRHGSVERFHLEKITERGVPDLYRKHSWVPKVLLKHAEIH